MSDGASWLLSLKSEGRLRILSLLADQRRLLGDAEHVELWTRVTHVAFTSSKDATAGSVAAD
jgi:hypothetical protein